MGSTWMRKRSRHRDTMRCCCSVTPHRKTRTKTTIHSHTETERRRRRRRTRNANARECGKTTRDNVKMRRGGQGEEVGSVETIATAVTTRDQSARQVMEKLIQSVEKREKTLNCFVHLNSEAILKAADEVDARVASFSSADEARRAMPLCGVPVSIKDNLCTRDMPTTAGSRVLDAYVPPYDADVVQRLREAGAVLVGKTNLDAFGMGSSTENSDYGVTRNPCDEERVPGGSSGGAAAAVAAGFCTLSIGSDTGGSIRQPASFCGTVGLKPSYGRVSRAGLVAYASSLDTVGPLSMSVRDCAAALDAIAGCSENDATSASGDVTRIRAGVGADDDAAPSFVEALARADTMDASSSKPLNGTRVGLLRETMDENGVDACVRERVTAAMERLEMLGARVEEVSVPSFGLGLPAYYVIASSEASSNLSRYDGVRYGQRNGTASSLNDLYRLTRDAGFGAEVKRRVLMGTYALSAGYYDAYYKRAQQARLLISRELDRLLDERFDVLASPAAPTVAYRIGEKTNDPLSMYLGDLMTVNANLAGVPALVVPTPPTGDDSETMPVGLQLIGRMFGESELFRIGHAFQNL